MKNKYSDKLINQLLNYETKEFNSHDFKIYRNRNILITGASGLLGLKILFFFVSINLKYKLNIKITATYNSKLYTFVRNYLNKLGFITIIKINLYKNNLNRKMKFDYIFHCAGYGQPVKFMKYQSETFHLNSKTIFDLKNNLNSNGIFIYLSTSEIYSGNKYICYENSQGLTMPDHFRSPYIESKRFGESFTINNIKNFYIFRVCLNYGPGVKLNDDRVLNQVILRSITENRINIYGGYNQDRANLYIDDSITLMMKCLISKKFGIYNLSSSDRVKLGKLFDYISKISNKKLVDKSKKVTMGAPNIIKISNKKITDLAKYNPKTNYKKGILQTYEWYYNLLKYEKKI